MKTRRDIWPDGKKFALCLTHDVDKIDKSWWHCAYYLLKGRDFNQIESLFTKNKEMPYWNFERIMDIEKRYGVRSTFFFLNETKKANLLKYSTYALSFGYYNIKDPRILGVINTLDAGGWEIGVHGSYDSYQSKKLLLGEKETLETILGKRITGIRQHYLNLDVPKTWLLHKEAGFEYDSSFGFRDRPGFRDGKDLPFYTVDGGPLEIPLAIMDGPLFKTSGNNEVAWHTCQELVEYSEEHGSILTILWHNDRFNDSEYPGQGQIYEDIIKECQKRGAWVATGGEVASWWTR